ncbi:MAG: permease-like cell division protein FtsX, partial [Muribaculaceae bacterium]|nr:permease-like cell division protein FtsX [Muribaculaceae bacterium]
GIAARSVTTSIRENMGFDVVMAEETQESAINKLKQMWNSAPYVASYTYYSPADAMRQWQHDTGEDLVELLGVNPFSPEFEVKVKARYASVDSIRMITAPLHEMEGVAEVNVHAEMVESVNNNLHTIMLILVVAAGALTLISFVLINNTVRLTVYSKRFLIHTMRLVGATHGFIRRPFIVGNAIQGIVAAIVAMVLLGSLLCYAHSVDSSVANIVGWSDMAWVFASMLAAGVAICTLAAFTATNRYLRLSYDEMFK